MYTLYASLTKDMIYKGPESQILEQLVSLFQSYAALILPYAIGEKKDQENKIK